MIPVITFAALFLLAGVMQGAPTSVDFNARIRALSLSDLKQRLVTIDHELGQLASLSLRSGVGSMGY